MPAQSGFSYMPKSDDHMRKLLVRACPTCGAQIGELCIMRSGKRVHKVTEVHAARFSNKRRTMTDHYAAI